MTKKKGVLGSEKGPGLSHTGLAQQWWPRGQGVALGLSLWLCVTTKAQEAPLLPSLGLSLLGLGNLRDP